MMLKEEVIETLKQDIDLQLKLAKYFNIRPQTVWHMAHRNKSHKLHSIFALMIIQQHLNLGLDEILYTDLIMPKYITNGVV